MSNNEKSMLKLINIKKEYIVAGQKIEALKGINLEFRENEFVSILGPSGCGKTTMLNLIGGLDKYSSGDLIINGTSTSNFSDSDWDAYRNNSIGFVFQSYNLIPHLTILGNVELALTLSGVSKNERVERAKEVLTKVGLELHINKKPNQLSGGQMQRVAIARALINNPDIILADEPTGALDSETSVQIMDLLKEVAKEKLVIMVTHNPELAVEYSSRIVKFKDGQLVEDNNPFKEVVVNESNFKPKKTAMPFKMALSLSLKNLLSKKTRTMITAIAGSIGIIGISCVLALSNGFQGYVDKLQTDLMSEYPLELSQVTFDMSALFEALEHSMSLDKFPTNEEVFSGNTSTSDLQGYYNLFTEDFITHLQSLDNAYYNEILLSYGLNLNVYTKYQNGNIVQVTTASEGTGDAMMDMMMPSSDPWGQLVSNTDFLNNQYDILSGRLPSDKSEVVLFVDEYNQISTDTLINLGLLSSGSTVGTSVSFDNIIGKQFKLFTNDQIYTEGINTETSFQTFNKKSMSSTLYTEGMDLEIVGVMRINSVTSSGSMSSTIGYTKELSDYLLDIEKDSNIVKFINLYGGVVNPYTGELLNGASFGFDLTIEFDEDFDYFSLYSAADFGGSTTPTSIKIYPKTFESKSTIKNHIEEYNNTFEEDSPYRIIYVDSVEMMVSSMNTMISSISYVLIAFTSISLVVSSVMIGIITYVSVIERTKEIGVLRSIGARKKDISRVFNAETIIIGFTAGMIAIIFTYLVSIPTNIIVKSLLEVENIANLNPIAAFILVVISIMLTLIAGLIPSGIAAKKDPVMALRSE